MDDPDSRESITDARPNHASTERPRGGPSIRTQRRPWVSTPTSWPAGEKSRRCRISSLTMRRETRDNGGLVASVDEMVVSIAAKGATFARHVTTPIQWVLRRQAASALIRLVRRPIRCRSSRAQDRRERCRLRLRLHPTLPRRRVAPRSGCHSDLRRPWTRSKEAAPTEPHEFRTRSVLFRRERRDSTTAALVGAKCGLNNGSWAAASGSPSVD